MRAEIVGSGIVARALVAALRVRATASVVTSVLVDDKKSDTDKLEDHRRAAVIRSVHELGADQVMLESELVRHVTAFQASLPVDSPVPERFARRLACHGELACSQDIAIWHALRLGLFRPVDPGWAARSHVAGDDTPADVSVAVLPRRGGSGRTRRRRMSRTSATWAGVCSGTPDDRSYADGGVGAS